MKAAAVIGTGYWGRKHVEEYHRLGIDVYAVDLRKENTDFCAEKGWVKGTYNDVQDVIKNPDIRYVSICTPNNTHYQMAKMLLLAGKHVLVEKPFVMEAHQGAELIEIAKKRSLNISVGHIFRFNNAVNYVRNCLNAGDFGEPYVLKLSWTNLEPIYPDRDVLFDLAAHPFDIADYLFSVAPDEIACFGQGYRQGQVEAAFINSHIGKTLLNIEVSWVTPKKERSLVLVGSKATVFVECARQKVTIYDNEAAAYRDVDLAPNNTLSDEILEFVRCAENRGTSTADAEVGVKIVKLLECAKLSITSGKIVKAR